MDLDRIAALADDLERLASAKSASFGIYREVHEEDAFARGTTDGVVLFAVDLLRGVTRIDNPVGNSLIALDPDAPYVDRNADLTLHAVELYGEDLAPPRHPRLRVAKKEYAAIIGCLFALVTTTILALAGAIWLGNWALGYLFGG